jgi:hypothetical protein
VQTSSPALPSQRKQDVTKIAVDVFDYQWEIETAPAQEIMVKSCNSWQGKKYCQKLKAERGAAAMPTGVAFV